MNTSMLSNRTLLISRWARALLALSLLLAPVLASGQEVRSPAREMAAPSKDATSTRIILVEWRIKKGREQEFVDYWSKQATITDRSGLIGEFLSRVEDRKQFPWMVWNLDPRWTTFVNVGIWRSGADFDQQIGRFINNAKPPLAFEAQKRRRVLVAPERWRIGATPFLELDHSEVR